MPNRYSGENAVSQQAQTFYDRTLLERLKPKLVFLQYGQKKPIPKREGATGNWRRFTSLSPATTPLVEGVTPQGDRLVVEHVSATVQGYGNFVYLTDLLDMAGIDPVATETVELMGENAAETLDIVVRDVVARGTNVYRVNGRVDRNSVQADDIIDGATMRRARRIMARNNAKPVPGAGAYIGIVHPDVAYDIMGDPAWVNANQYAGSQKIFDGEIGKMHGVRYIESTLAPVFEGEGADGIDVYGTIIIGANAYGVPDIAGSSKPKTIIKSLGSGGTSDPLEQRSSIGWKAYLAAVRLDELCILRVESAVTA
jgi:N4-gp56 family major capsid protein